MFYRFTGDSRKFATVPDRSLPAPEDRAPALAIVEWAAEDEEAELLDPAAVKELRALLTSEPWSTDARAWSVAFYLALRVWEIGYARKNAAERVAEAAEAAAKANKSRGLF